MVATLCALANEIVVMPAALTWQTDEQHKTTNYAFGFAIPTNTPGLKFICRPPVAHLDAASPMDGPLSLRYDESDGIAVFDDVMVPWERVFLFRDKEAEAVIRGKTGAGPHALHQSVVRAVSKSQFMMALALAIAKSTKLTSIITYRSCWQKRYPLPNLPGRAVAAEAEAHETPYGTFAPAMRHNTVWQIMFWKLYNRQCEIINTLGAGGLVGVPSFAELAGEAKGDVEKYFQSVNADSSKRIKLNRLAYDAALSSCAGRQRLYEQYYSGDPMRSLSQMYRSYSKDTHIDRIHDMLDDLEAVKIMAGLTTMVQLSLPVESSCAEDLVDADACPVRDEVVKVAKRHELRTYMVSDGGIRPFPEKLIELVVVHWERTLQTIGYSKK